MQKSFPTKNDLTQQTLREKLSTADLLVRELVEHLERGQIPKIHLLRRTTRQGVNPLEQGAITDASIRTSVETVLNSGKFSREVTDQLLRVLSSIETDVKHQLEMD
ncbi:hypothetical protein [Planctomicrobium piriforme]|uniref:Uncharacterized protein n=1 Tax=Planctomicrobium piriforme TaxID=1576369 RepID=A0A1I3S8A8_9PLAN|nr:hypothetical protein [Planctomicrobium piriforme]SFJ54928.1 hypothetical protein SAMN05421753_12355 [Planctomicrobium piriforme]